MRVRYEVLDLYALKTCEDYSLHNVIELLTSGFGDYGNF